MISKETTKEFQEAIKEEYGKNLSSEDASVILNDLVIYFDTLAKIEHISKNGP